MTSENNPILITNSLVTPSSYKKEVILPTAQETYFVTHIDIFTDEFEILRKKAITARTQRWLTGILMLIGVTLVFLWQSAVLALALFLPLSISVIFMLIDIDAPKYRYNKKVKDKVFPVIFKYFGNEFIYSQICPWRIAKIKGFNLGCRNHSIKIINIYNIQCFEKSILIKKVINSLDSAL